MSEARGVFQSDLIIRTAILDGIDELRRKPYLLPYVFASLLDDELTRNEYGQTQLDAARTWFLNTKIVVFMSTVINSIDLPGISITLLDSVESESVLADTHYIPEEDDDRTWPVLAGPFTPTGYEASTGTMTLPDSVTLVLAPGQQVVDQQGNLYPILEVQEDNTILIREGVTADFTAATIRGQRPSGKVHWNSTRMKETYSIGCHVVGEQVLLTYLHSILVFVLLRSRKRLLEARGFERSQISSSDFRRLGDTQTELAFSRHLNLTGYVTQVVPEEESQKVTGVAVAPLRVIDAGNLPNDTDPDDAIWVGEHDEVLSW
jgi:hypothetical protein